MMSAVAISALVISMARHAGAFEALHRGHAEAKAAIIRQAEAIQLNARAAARARRWRSFDDVLGGAT